MSERFARAEMMMGPDAMERLTSARVLIFGVGGVGGYVCEALARSGVGHFCLVDGDTVAISNINRQIIALDSTVGRYKTEVMAERIRDIHPEAEVEEIRRFVLPEDLKDFPFDSYDYVVDAVDTVAAKLAIITGCKAAGVPVVSAMGAGNKTDGSRFRISDIYATKGCPLARVMRKELKKRGVTSLKVAWSDEEPENIQAEEPRTDAERPEAVFGSKKRACGSLMFVTAIPGLLIAGEVVRDLTNNKTYL